MPEPASDYARILDLIVQVEGFVTSLQARTHDAEAARDEAQKALAAAQADLEKAQSDLVLTAEQVAELEKRLEALSAPNGGDPPPPPPPPQAGLPEHLRHLGPIPTLAQLDKLSPDYANQIRLYFDATDPIQQMSQADKWAKYKFSYDHTQVESTTNPEIDNYYDRGAHLLVWEYILGGRPAMRDYAKALTDSYLQYVANQSFGPVANMVFTHGLRAQFVLTGDEKYREAIGRMADYFAVPYYMGSLRDLAAEMDSRMAAYLIRTYQAAAEIKAPSVGTPGRVNGGNDWEALLRKAVVDVIASQDGDGSRRRTFVGGWPGPTGNKPFMEGLLNSALINAHGHFTNDPKLQGLIVDSVARSVKYLCEQNFRTKPEPSPYNPTLMLSNAFVYQEATWPGSLDNKPYPAPDLNFLIIPAIAWAALMTGDKKYIPAGDAAFASTIAVGSWQYDKQLNELLGGYTYAAWRAQLAA